MTDLGVFAVDVADLAFDVVAQDLVALHPFAARRGQLNQHGVVALGAALGEQLGKGFQPNVDALGVVEPVDAEQDLARVAQLGPDLAGPAPDVAVTGRLVERAGVDGDGEGAHPDHARPELDLAEPRAHPDRSAGGVGAEQPPGQEQEVLGAAGQVEPHQVGAEQAFDDLGAPRHLHEQLHRRERDVQEEADGQVGPQLAQHLGDQLQLVVLHPHRRALGGGA